MANEDSDDPPSGKSFGLSAIILAAAIAMTGFVAKYEGTKYKAYQDPGGHWTICRGHRAGVKAGDVASKATCDRYYREDMIFAMNHVASVTPELKGHVTALQASGDFVLNTGPRPWKPSPMARQFATGHWVEGCEAFTGYYVTIYANHDLRSTYCKPENQGFRCTLKVLVKRREDEKEICLHGLPDNTDFTPIVVPPTP